MRSEHSLFCSMYFGKKDYLSEINKQMIWLKIPLNYTRYS